MKQGSLTNLTCACFSAALLVSSLPVSLLMTLTAVTNFLTLSTFPLSQAAAHSTKRRTWTQAFVAVRIKIILVRRRIRVECILHRKLRSKYGEIIGAIAIATLRIATDEDVQSSVKGRRGQVL